MAVRALLADIDARIKADSESSSSSASSSASASSKSPKSSRAKKSKKDKNDDDNDNNNDVKAVVDATPSDAAVTTASTSVKESMTAMLASARDLCQVALYLEQVLSRR